MPDQFWGARIFWGPYSMWAVYVAAHVGVSVAPIAGETERRVVIRVSGSLAVPMAAIQAFTGKNAAIEGHTGQPAFTASRMATTAQTKLAAGIRIEVRYTPVCYVHGASGTSATVAMTTERLGPARKNHFWGGSNRVVVYETGLVVPAAADGAELKLEPFVEIGSISRIEYGYGRLKQFWDDDRFWGKGKFWGYPDSPTEWLLWPSSLTVHVGEYVMIRLFSGSRDTFRMCNLQWIFDVEDAELRLSDIHIPREGIRLPVPEYYFRWIHTLTFGLQYVPESTAVNIAWVDKGVEDDTGVTSGPLVICLDSNGDQTSGNADVRIRGAKGVNYVLAQYNTAF